MIRPTILAGLAAACLAAPATAQEDVARPATARTGNLTSFEAPPAPETPTTATQPSRGAIISLYVSDQGSDNFAKFRGMLMLDFVGTGVTEYKWGGSTCPGRQLSEASVQLLALAQANGLRITPETKPGQGGALCMTGFTISG